MDNKIESLLPSLTSNIVTKILAIELYFLLTLSKSPIYFTLSDFLDSHSIELLYISVTLFLLAPWIFPFAMAIYFFVAGAPAWIFSKLLNFVKWDGLPVFRLLRDRKDDSSVSIEVAKDYAFRNHLTELSQRIEDYQLSNTKHMEGEAIATTNFLLIFLIVIVSDKSSPNFLMKVTGVLEPYLANYAYVGVVTLLLIQGVVGRISGFHLLRDAGSLHPDFFRDDIERAKAADWVNQIARKHEPHIMQWLRKNQMK